MKKYINFRNLGIAVLALAVIFFLWNMRPQGIETIMKEWKDVNRAYVIDMWVYAGDDNDRELTDGEFAQFREIMESAVFTNRMYAGDTMYGRLYGVYLYKDSKTYLDQSLNMRVFVSDQGYVYIGDCYRYYCDKHDELWAFVESLDLTT